MTFHIPWDPFRRAVRGAPVSVFPFVQHSIRSWEAPFHNPAGSTSRPFHLPRGSPGRAPGGEERASHGPGTAQGSWAIWGRALGSSVPIARRPDRSRRREIAGKWRRVALPPVPGTGFLEPAGAGGAGYEGIRLPEVEAHGRLTPFRDSAPDRKLGSKKFPAYRTPQERKCLERL